MGIGANMILTGSAIQYEIRFGSIEISGFVPSRLGPNSYNLTLHNELLIYFDNGKILDCKKNNRTIKQEIPSEGLTLQPGILYLGRTVEYTRTHNHVPLIEGRSSLARLGINVHVSAGFGDIGYAGYWTLEITVVHPVIIYPFIEICQIYYHTVQGLITKRYKGKYQGSTEILPSKLYQELTPSPEKSAE